MQWRRYLVATDIWIPDWEVKDGKVKRTWRMKSHARLRRLWIEIIGVFDRG